MQFLSAAALLAALGTATGLPNSNFNVTPEYAAAHGCGSKCQQILRLGNAADLDAVGHDFAFDFFATAGNFSEAATRPSDVLKVQVLDGRTLNVDSGTTVFRIQYATRDLDGRTVPATGFVAFPFTPDFAYAHNGTARYRLAAFAHGTIGLFAGCAPSNSPDLYDYSTWQAAVQRGYAVVATDYAGLGNNYTTHKYLTLPAHVHDVYYSVVAARKLFGRVLTREWVSFGHSQGGGAVWKLAESEYVRNDTDYLGTVAMAPATYIIDMLRGPGVDFTGYLSFLPFAAKRALPGYQPAFLSDVMSRRLELAETAQLCINGMLGLTLDLDKEQLFSAAGLAKDMESLEAWQRMLAPAQGDRSPAPVLVVQGLNDTSVLAPTTEAAWRNACRYGNEVHLRRYRGQDHSPLMQASAPEWLAWMDDLFASRRDGRSRPARRCTAETRTPFSPEFVKQPPEAGDELMAVLEGILNTAQHVSKRDFCFLISFCYCE
ncbi:hypothetical protein MANI_026533 [Metarhizium anisopliae]|nr:hypothetical protein MANI_026533 [Metarhizium anisopliae]